MIELRGLCKYFGQLTAVDHLSLTVEPGEVLGFIGPNGAGKTTTIRMLATLLPPDAGTATINGLDIIENHDEVRACLGYMPDFFGVYDRMLVWEYLDFFACAHQIPYGQRAGLISNVLELVDLADKREADVATLSRGMKQRLCLGMTLVHDPQVLLLDEPASGLDPRSRIEMRQLLQELARMDKTIIISSHILTELAEICTKVAILDRGRLVMAGSMEEMAQRLGSGQLLTIKLADRREEACSFLAGCPQVERAEIREDTVLVTLRGDDESQQQLLALLIEQGFPVRSFAREEVNLEDVYMRAIQDTERAD